MRNTKLKNKLIFVFLLIVGNAAMALLTFSSEPNLGPTPQELPERPDYVEIRITGKLKAEFRKGAPVTLLGQSSGENITGAFLIKQYQPNPAAGFLPDEKREEYLISVPKDLISSVLAEETFVILPYGINPKRKREVRYEVVY